MRVVGSMTTLARNMQGSRKMNLRRSANALLLARAVLLWTSYEKRRLICREKAHKLVIIVYTVLSFSGITMNFGVALLDDRFTQ